jgi:predicted CopG family antitoxin
VPTRKTVTLDDDVRTKLEAEMKKSGKSFKETVNETLRSGLAVRQDLKVAKPFKVRPKAMGLKPGYSYDKVWELIEGVEGPDHR